MLFLDGQQLTRILHEFEAFICKAFKDTAHVPQALDNAANGRLRLAQRVKNFEKLDKKLLLKTATLYFEANLHISV